MKNTRRAFIQKISSAYLLGTSLGFRSMANDEWQSSRNKVKLRLLVASDIHYGQPNTDFEGMTQTFIEKANAFHAQFKCDFVVVNGDLIHDKPEFMQPLKSKLDLLEAPYFLSRGNHDRISEVAWLSLWQKPVNHYFSLKNTGFVLANTSNEKGEYLSPDLIWLEATLKQLKSTKSVILFVHIPQKKWTANAIENPRFFELLNKYKNVKAVFHGHEHDQDGIKTLDGIPYIFDSHIGGNWGTPHKGFRVMEILKDETIITYLMSPDDKLSQETFENK